MLSSHNFLILSLVEAIYVVYMMNFFKTKYSLAHPLTYFENKMLYHPIGKSDKPICNICPLGNYGSIAIAVYVILRWILFVKLNKSKDRKNLKLFSIFALVLVILLCMLNFNAVVYLIPYFATEIYIIRNIL
tara:strand:+ start:1408 stop:1803 length:396 start_codon:yes stop_codon:yes gene_type:complete